MQMKKRILLATQKPLLWNRVSISFSFLNCKLIHFVDEETKAQKDDISHEPRKKFAVFNPTNHMPVSVIELLHLITTLLNCFLNKDHSVSANRGFLLLWFFPSGFASFHRKYYIYCSENLAKLLLNSWMVETP